MLRAGDRLRLRSGSFPARKSWAAAANARRRWIFGPCLERIAARVSEWFLPGVPPGATRWPPRGRGVPIQAEPNWDSRRYAGVPYVAIHGTNGKTTTTALVATCSLPPGATRMRWNIGTPLSEIALEEVRPDGSPGVSSFQLHDMRAVSPRWGFSPTWPRTTGATPRSRTTPTSVPVRGCVERVGLGFQRR